MENENLKLRSKGSRVRVAPRAPIYGLLAVTAPTSGGVGAINLDLCTLSRPKVVQFKKISWKESPDWTRNT